MSRPLSIAIDRTSKVTLAEQIRRGISHAIDNGTLLPGARLPSWRDLAAQLGVARGTVRTAYEQLIDAQLIVSFAPGGSRVADRPAMTRPMDTARDTSAFVAGLYRDFTRPPAIFQMGVPAQDCFPAKLVSRIRSRAVRAEVGAAASYPNPKGEIELRREIARHVALARGIECVPSQIIVTSGFSGGLGLTLHVLGLAGRTAWVEDPSFVLTRKALELARLRLEPVPVDEHGMDVAYALRTAPDAALAVVTPGQHSPLGSTLALDRRLSLLDWAHEQQAWIIEDDYLSELRLKGRSAPALASLDKQGRVIHLGSFSKTFSPALRLGFIVAPSAMAERFSDFAACLAPAPGPSVQIAVAELMRDGHYMRHLRRTKRAYARRRDALLSYFASRGHGATAGGLAVVLSLPEGVSDIAVAAEANAIGLAPLPLSPWYTKATPRAGLLLNVATTPLESIAGSCERLCEIIERMARKTA